MEKPIASTLALLVTLLSQSAMAQALIGDVNKDNKVDVADISAIIGIMAGYAPDSLQQNSSQDGNVYYVRGGDSLLESILNATKEKNSVVYVEDGEYDLMEEFIAHYGDNFFDIYDEKSVRGIILNNGIKIVFSKTATVVFNYDGANDNVKHYFSPFNSGQYGFTLENLNLEASNCRYCIHDERGSSEDLYVNRYINCYMKLDNSKNNIWNHGTQSLYGYPQCIGGGLGKNGEIEIRGCRFKSMGIDSLNNYTGYSIVSYHNSISDGARSVLYVSGNYFEDKGGFRLSWYGSSSLKTLALLSNNSFGRSVEHRNETGNSVCNTEIIEWNNIVRTNY